MPISRRYSLTAIAAGLTVLGIAAAAEQLVRPKDNAANKSEVVGLIQRSQESNAALMRGDIETYRSLITLTDDFTLMSPFGGKPTRGADVTAERWQAMGRMFKNGTLEQEVIQSYASGDMVVLSLIERAKVEVGGLPAQNWALRVTLVYRREGADWQLAYRHADPLAPGITLAQAAALARGE